MQPQTLVVSDPPHNEVDLEAAATALGLDVGDARVKISFRAPEVLAASDPDRSSATAAALRGAGLELKVVDGGALVGVPWPRVVTGFALGSGAMLLQLGGDDVALPYDAPLIGVSCRPPDGFPLDGPDGDGSRSSTSAAEANPGLAVAETIQWMSTLDLFYAQGSTVHRVTFARDLTDFTGLGELCRADATENVATTLTVLRDRLANLTVDDRLEDVRPRKRFVMGDQSFDLDLRKRFSFGTLLLRQVLDSISPELRDLTQWELGARLAYVLRTS